MKALRFLIGFLMFLLTVSGVAYGQAYTWTNAFPGLVFSNALSIASPPGDMNRLFVVEKHGRIIVITNLANPTRTVFMDISDRVVPAVAGEYADRFNEEGMLSMAFHPHYAENGFFYVFYTGGATNGGIGLHDIVSRFQVSPSTPNQGNPDSELQMILQRDETGHNAGDMHFGLDGYLYISVGDKGGQANQWDAAQYIDRDFFSGILRIDVDKGPGSLAPNPHAGSASTSNYGVPPNNPWVGATHFDGQPIDTSRLRTEFWAVGLRNPWRFSIDPVTGIVYVGDVGQSSIEEINVITSGGNYGWGSWEGNTSPPAGVPTNGWPVAENPLPPLIMYDHTIAAAIIGGVVYRGGRFPDLYGSYVHADFFGKVWRLTHSGSTVTSTQLLFDDPDKTTCAFGVDPSNNDVLYISLRKGTNSIIKRIVASSAATGSLQVTLEPSGAASDGAQWRLPGGAWQDSGTIVSGLPVGNVTVAFKSVPGWNAPGDQPVTIADGATTTATGAYTVLTETTHPTVNIASPTLNLHVSDPAFQASGTAHDNVKVAEVWFELNGGGWNLAAGTTSWTADLNLAPGPNTLRVYAVDTSGNVSATNDVNFVLASGAVLAVQVNGGGQVVPNYNGQSLEMGRPYSMTAKPNKGFVFNGWSGSVASSRTKLTFVMAPDLSLTAGFSDVSRPVNIVTSPRANRSASGPPAAAFGRAMDNDAVASVFYQLNGTGWGLASTIDDWANWTTPELPLLSGPNLIQAYATDNAGNVSRTNSVKFNYAVTPSADWAPDSLSGLVALLTPDAGAPSQLSFDVSTFSRNSDSAAVGHYSYSKLDTNVAQLTLTDSAPSANAGNPVNIGLVFTDHYSGVFNHDGAPGAVNFAIAPNLLPISLVRKTITTTSGTDGSRTTFKLGAGTFTQTPGGSGTYTFARYSPVAGVLTLVFTDVANAGSVLYLQVTFSSKNAGAYFETFDGSGPVTTDAGSFSVR